MDEWLFGLVNAQRPDVKYTKLVLRLEAGVMNIDGIQPCCFELLDEIDAVLQAACNFDAVFLTMIASRCSFRDIFSDAIDRY